MTIPLKLKGKNALPQSGKVLEMRLETPSHNDAATIAGKISAEVIGPCLSRLLELRGHFLCEVLLFLLDSFAELVTDKPVERDFLSSFL